MIGMMIMDACVRVTEGICNDIDEESRIKLIELHGNEADGVSFLSLVAAFVS